MPTEGPPRRPPKRWPVALGAGLGALLLAVLGGHPATAQGPPQPGQPVATATRPATATAPPRGAATASPTPVRGSPTPTPTPAGPPVFVPIRIPSPEQPSGPTGTIAGRVVDVSGRPMAGAVVRLWLGQFSVLATTGVDGGYVFAGLAPGPYQLAVQDRSSQIGTANLAPGETVLLNFVQRAGVPTPLPAAPGPSPLPAGTATPGATPGTPTATPGTLTPTPTATRLATPTPLPLPMVLVPTPSVAPTIPRVSPRAVAPLELLSRVVPWEALLAPLLVGALAGGVLVGLLALATLRRR